MDDLQARTLRMLQRLQFCVPTSHDTGKDTRACPICSRGHVHGLPSEHDSDCELAQLIRDAEAEY